MRDRPLISPKELCVMFTRLNVGKSVLGHYYCLFMKGAETSHIKCYVHSDRVDRLHVQYVYRVVQTEWKH